MPLSENQTDLSRDLYFPMCDSRKLQQFRPQCDKIIVYSQEKAFLDMTTHCRLVAIYQVLKKYFTKRLL